MTDIEKYKTKYFLEESRKDFYAVTLYTHSVVRVRRVLLAPAFATRTEQECRPRLEVRVSHPVQPLRAGRTSSPVANGNVGDLESPGAPRMVVFSIAPALKPPLNITCHPPQRQAELRSPAFYRSCENHTLKIRKGN